MKKSRAPHAPALLLAVTLLLPCFAALAAPSGLPPGTPGDMPLSYISSRAVPLSAKEIKALELSDTFAKTDIPPVLSGGGKIIYVHGAVLPSIIASPMQVCDVELQAGELVNEIIVGDSARWMIESGVSGVGADERTHLFIKPVDAGLESTAIITTNRRVYHLRLISRTRGHTPYVGFSYAEDLNRQALARKRQDQKRAEWSSATVEGQRLDLSKLNFNYSVKGDKVSWRPLRVYDDGRQTFLQLPAALTGEMPVLLVRKGGTDVLVNYRINEGAMIVDGLFERIVLVLGVGSDQEKVEVRREG
ncbi:MAG: P-type conjugative transfer protein TrbG [Desulfovibrio sp.]|jgi:type IV secretion system protein VirB9|nr:P-type conjugative transfer protein TrbG [Desulfovibrio sp.]